VIIGIEALTKTLQKYRESKAGFAASKPWRVGQILCNRNPRRFVSYNMGNIAMVQARRPEPIRVERELIQRCQRGDQSAFELLLKKFERRVFGLIYQIVRSSSEVDDIAQEVFTKLYFSLPQFRLEASFEAWLYRITVNQCYDFLRKKKRDAQVAESDLSDEEALFFEKFGSITQPHYPDVSKRLEVRQTAERLLNELPPRDRSLLILKEIEELSIEELTEVFKTSASAIKLRLFRARNHLKLIYEKSRKKCKGKAAYESSKS
jgi:RNA polymerase sigma-70 factor, ECF subfamily